MAIITKIFTRLVLPAGVVVSVPLVVPLIYADDRTTGKLINAQDLPIYDVPRGGPIVEVSENDSSPLENGVSSVRKALFSRIDTLEDTKQGAIRILQKGGRYTEDAVHYVRDEKNIVPRAVAITVSGLAGLLIGARGGVFKKVIYSTTGILGMSSLCYPQQAVQISQDAYKIGKYYSIISYNRVFDEVTKSSSQHSSSSPQSLDKLAEQAKKPKAESERITKG